MESQYDISEYVSREIGGCRENGVFYPQLGQEGRGQAHGGVRLVSLELPHTPG